MNDIFIFIVGILFVGVNIYIYYSIYKEIEKNNNVNNRILNLKTEIININNVCKRLLLSNIYYHINNIKYNYIDAIIIILIFQLIIVFIILYLYSNYNYNLLGFECNKIIFSLICILLLSYIIVININICNNIYINKILYIIYDIEININNKKNEIHIFYRIKLLSVINTIDDINYINNILDEYIEISNNNLNLIIDKNRLMNELIKILIKNKHNELLVIMKTSLINMEITPEIVKNKLDEVISKLEDYEISLEMKIAKINELTQINEVIINL